MVRIRVNQIPKRKFGGRRNWLRFRLPARRGGRPREGDEAALLRLVARTRQRCRWSAFLSGSAVEWWKRNHCGRSPMPAASSRRKLLEARDSRGGALVAEPCRGGATCACGLILHRRRLGLPRGFVQPWSI